MDFFRKAHVVKSRTENKSEEALKKQLKIILHGYKNSNTKHIKSWADTHDINQLNDDSSSVSGFSDLNLTNSSNEANITIDTVASGMKDEDSSDVEVSNDEDMDNDNKSTNYTEDSASVLDANIQKLSSNVSNNSSSELTSDSSDDSSSISEASSEYDTNNSIFDDDGMLASKIIEKLEEKKSVKKNTQKRKLEAKPNEKVDSYNDKSMSNDEIKMLNKISPGELDINAQNDATESMSDSDSSPFISIQASDTQLECLSNVIGEYKHPTMKNLPTGIQNVLSIDTSGFSSIHDMIIEDVNMREEVGSLIPECDVKDTNKDIDSEVISNTSRDEDTIPALFDNNTKSNDTSMSETASTKDLSTMNMHENIEEHLKVFYGGKNCIIVLKHPTEIYVHGKVNLKILEGTIELLGYKLDNDKTCKVFAPYYNYAYCIKTIDTRNAFSGLFRKLITEGLLVMEAEEIVTNVGEFDAVIILQKLDSYKLDFVENSVTSIDLFSRSNKNVNVFFKKASELLGCSLYFKRQRKTFEESICWNEVVECGLTKLANCPPDEDNSKGIICGGKGVGKSTFLRYCVNSLLSRGPVLVIDLDPGQAEFTVAGNISATVVKEPLIGPSYTHLKTPNLMLNLGMINTMDNPRRYTAAVSELITYCYNQEQFKSMPWIVNTMGMTNSMGLKFITMIVLQTRPTFLFEIDSNNPKKKFEIHLQPEVVRKLYEDEYRNDALFENVTCPPDFDYRYIVANHVDNPVKNNYSLAPRDERYLNVLAYFGNLLTKHSEEELLSIVPYEVKLDDLYIGLNVKIKKDAVLKVVNGKIVELCELTTFEKDKVFSLENKPLKCHGIGLIRGVDLERRMVYIITPIELNKLSLVNTLVYADWMPELRGQEKHLPAGITIPYRTDTVYNKRQLMHAPRRRFNPLQLLKMSRNS